jgi:O-antigen/teichoic acid export membrane protein
MLIVTVGLSGIATAVNFALLPTATEEWVKGNLPGLGVLYNRITRLLLLASGPLIIIGVIFPATLLRLISPSFAAASNAFRILAIAGLLNGIGAPAIGVVNAMNRAKTVMSIYLAAVVISVGISLTLIPTLGMIGASMAYTAPTLVIAIVSLLYIRSQRINLQLSFLGRPMAFIFVSMAFGYLSVRFLGIIPALFVTLVLYSFAVVALGGIRHEDFELINQLTKGRVSLGGLNRLGRYVSLRRNEKGRKLDRTKCPICGFLIDMSLWPVKFCYGCGAPLTTSCPTCGWPIDMPLRPVKFCYGCGTPLTVSN